MKARNLSRSSTKATNTNDTHHDNEDPISLDSDTTAEKIKISTLKWMEPMKKSVLQLEGEEFWQVLG